MSRSIADGCYWGIRGKSKIIYTLGGAQEKGDTPLCKSHSMSIIPPSTPYLLLPIYLPTYPHTCSSYPLFFHTLLLCFLPTTTPTPTRNSVFLLSSLEETVYHFLLKASSPFKFLIPSLGLLKAQILVLHPVAHIFCSLSISHRVKILYNNCPTSGHHQHCLLALPWALTLLLVCISSFKLDVSLAMTLAALCMPGSYLLGMEILF